MPNTNLFTTTLIALQHAVHLHAIALIILVTVFATVVHANDHDLINEYNSLQDQMQALKQEYDSTYEDTTPESLRSTRKNSTVRIGGEVFTDYIGTIYEGKGFQGSSYAGNWYLHNTNLRFDFELSEDLKARIKFDLSDSGFSAQRRVMEEALLIWNAVCGGPIGLFFGVGEVPYGQDRTLGIIQSYNHTDGSDSSEGPIILSSPYLIREKNEYAVYHPGEIDRVVMVGATFAWDDILKFEFAVFQPDNFNNPIGYYDSLNSNGDSGFESLAARIWWNMPIDGLIAELSGVRKHDAHQDDNPISGYTLLADEYALSLGFDWDINNELEVFAEYEHGFNWGYIEGNQTDTVSIGLLYAVTERLTLGAMAEWLHISKGPQEADFNKYVLHCQYNFCSGVYLIAEYGAELYNWDGALSNVLAVRSGVYF